MLRRLGRVAAGHPSLHALSFLQLVVDRPISPSRVVVICCNRHHMDDRDGATSDGETHTLNAYSERASWLYIRFPFPASRFLGPRDMRVERMVRVSVSYRHFLIRLGCCAKLVS